MTVKHVKQPTLNTCVSACLSMITGIPVEDIVDEFHGRYYNNWDLTISEYLTHKGIKHHCVEGGGRETLTFGGLFLCTVPSLHVPGALHQVVVDMTDHKFIVHDPLKGWEGKKYYVGADQDPDVEGAFIMHNWVLDVVILPY